MIATSTLLEDARLVEHHRALLRGLGVSLPPGSTVMDFGCGKGHRVYQYRKAGYVRSSGHSAAHFPRFVSRRPCS